MDGSGLRFGILGPLAVARDGERLPVVGPKLRTVLAALLVRANTTVTVERLAEDLWGATPPASARKAAQLHVLRLRRIVGAAVLETGTDGYLVRVDPDRLDLLRFRGLVERARVAAPVEERALLAEALACWRGEALADVASDALRRDAVPLLAEERLAAHERYIEVSVDVGEPAELIADLGALTREHPWRESLWALLVLALHRAGRRADALDTYRTVRGLLVSELGVEPGPRLRAAHEAVLAEPAAVPPVPRAPSFCRLPPDPPGFSGRTADLAALDAALSSACRIAAVVGPAGVGKTALAVRWAHRVRDRFPDGQLFVDLRGFAATAPVSASRALALCLRGLGVPGRRVPVALDEQVALYRSLLAGRRVLVVLDNAADAEQVRPLLPLSEGSVALVTSRCDLRGLSVLDGARVLGLDALADGEARALLGRLLDADPAEVGEVADLCGNLPLALRVAATNLVGGKYASVGGYATALRADRLAALSVDGEPGLAVRAAFQRSYEAVDEPARRLFRLLGRVPGTAFGGDVATALVGSAAAARRALDRLVSASLLVRSAPDRYRFHELLRECAAACAREEDLPGDLAAADTRLYDHYLATAVAAHTRLYPSVRRLLPADPGPAVFDSDGAALRWLDDERPHLVAAAERATASAGLRRYCGGLADALRGHLADQGCAEDGLALAHAALRAADEDGDPRTEVVGLVLLGTIAYRAHDYPDAIARLTRALDLCGRDPAAEIECRHRLGRVFARLGRPREAMRHHERALAVARRSGDEAAEAMAIAAVGAALLALGRVEGAIACHTRAIEVGTRLGDRLVRLVALTGIGLAHRTAGRLREAELCHRESAGLADRWGLRTFAATALVRLAETLCDLGRHPEAEALARRALEQGSRLGEPRQEAGALAVLATAARGLGRLEESVETYRSALELFGHIGSRPDRLSVLIGLSAACREAGNPAEAAAHAEDALSAMAEAGMHVMESAARTELAAAHLALGDLATAVRHVDSALKSARENGQRLAEARALLVSARLRATPGDEHAASAILAELGAPA